MFKIGEFSKLTQVSIRMLRYYDETGLLKPARIDKNSGYRFYSASQIPTLNKIIFLRDVGFNVAETAVALERWGDEFISAQLQKKQKEISETIKTYQEKLSKIQLAREDIIHEKIELHYNVTVKPVPGCQVLSLRKIIPNYYAESRLWEEMSAFVKTKNIAIDDRTFSIYHDLEYKEKDVDVELCAAVTMMGKDEDGFVFRKTEPVEYMACTMVYGDFSHISGVYLAFADWLTEHNFYNMLGTSRQIVHRGPWNETNPDNYLTEIQIPLDKIR